MSELKVNKISPRSGTDVTLGDSGDTFTLGSGANIAGLTLSDNILFDTASKGIYLGVTSATASNLLDDYEEGTWTAVIRGSTTAGTYELSANRCTYTKIGDFVHAKIEITFAGSLTGGGSGNFEIDGFPFTPSVTDNVGDQAASFYAIQSTRTGTTFLRLRVTGRARFYSFDNAGNRTIEAISRANANGQIIGVINYKITE